MWIFRYFETMKRLIITLVFSLVTSHLLISQNEIDSLKAVLLLQENDTNKLNSLKRLTALLINVDADQSIQYANEMIAISKQLDNAEWLAKSYLRKGAALRIKNEFDSAKANLLYAIPEFEASKDYFGLQSCWYELAIIEKNTGNLDSASVIYKKVVDLDEKVQNHSITAKSYNSYGGVYYRNGEFDQAREYYLKGLELAKKYGLASTEAFSAYCIGTMYMQMDEHEKGRPFLEDAKVVFDSLGQVARVNEIQMLVGVIDLFSGNLDEAKLVLNSSLDFFREKQYGRLMVNCLQHLSIIHNKQKEFTQAIKTAKEGSQIALEIGLIREALACNTNLANAYLSLNQYDSALLVIDESLQLNEANQNTLAIAVDLADIKWKALRNLEKNEEALIALQQFNSLSDSLRKKTDDERFAQLEVEYEVEKKEQEIETQKLLVRNEKKFNELLYAGIAILIVLIVVIAISYFNKQKANRLLAAKNQLISEQAEKLKELDNTKTKFFNNVAHELRTPLTLMAGHMESMLNDRFGGLNENQRKNVLVAKRNSNRLMDLVSEILDLGKLESGKMELKEKIVGLYPFLDRIFFTFESLSYQFNIKLKFDYQLDKNLCLLLDESKMEKALNNLIHNAIKYTPRGGEVLLKAFKAEGFVQIQVKDNGKGIVETEQSRVFERYYQTSDANAPAQGGTGIGLALVKEFIELHSGQVSLQSQKGKGSVFTIQIPIKRKTKPIEMVDIQNEKEEDFPLYPILEKKDKTILVVDDHKEMQQYLKDIIGRYAKVLIANDGVEALEILEKNSIDLITVDLMMPNMDGVGLLKQLKEKPEFAALPSIMLTARAAEEDKLNALQIGVSDYITKPFSQLELLARIANLLENKFIREVEKTNDDSETVDNQLIEKLRSFINANLDNSDLSVSLLAQEIGLSEKQLTRNVKSTTGLTPLKFIREIKLIYALEQLKSNNFHTVAEVSYAIGIDNPSHFAKLFKERFGKSPSEYIA